MLTPLRSQLCRAAPQIPTVLQDAIAACFIDEACATFNGRLNLCGD